MPQLIVSTRNPGKLVELERLLAGSGWQVRAAADAGVPEVVEVGATLDANAAAKALAAANATGAVALGDDTGLEVDALGGAPGVRSARFAGEQATYADNNAALLCALADVPLERRGARFRTVLALARPTAPGASEVVASLEGVLEGQIATSPRGEHGFGYDPLFVVAGDGRTLAELTLAEKNRVSHRARALAALRERLARLLDPGLAAAS